MPSERAAAIMDVVQRLKSGDLDARIETVPGDVGDIAVLVAAVNQLAETMLAREQLYLLTQQVAGENLRCMDQTTGELGRAREADRQRFAETIRRMALPVIEVWDRVLVVPVVGLLDTQRASELTINLLAKITSQSAKFAIIDLTSIEAVDAGTAEHLFRMVCAVRVIGAQAVLSGISPHVAHIVVNLGVDLSGIQTFSTLRQALRACIPRAA